MARTKGAISSVNIAWQDLKDLLGETYNGKVPVNVVWLRNHISGTEDFTLVRRGELNSGVLGLDVERTQNQPVVRRPKFEILGPEAEVTNPLTE
jgi:hypothetical protein